MPYLMVNLDDHVDCRRGVKQLKKHLNQSSGSGGDVCEPKPDNLKIASLPVRQKLERISQRGIWKHLTRIAEEIDSPHSLPEMDALLGLPENKMRSLKAIMGKPERRLGIRFLRVAPNAGEDDNGNPRYIMPPNIRKVIKNIEKSKQV